MSITLHLTQDDDVDALLSRDPFALLVGMLLDQQIAMEVAFTGPKKIAERMDGLSVTKIAEADPDEFVELCVTKPAIHRYGASMARRVQALAQHLAERYDGDATGIWTTSDPDGREVLKRLKALPGYGDQKARIFLALLGKQLGAEPEGWREAAGAYGEEGARRSIADVTDTHTLGEVREFKKQRIMRDRPPVDTLPRLARLCGTRSANRWTSLASTTRFEDNRAWYRARSEAWQRVTAGRSHALRIGASPCCVD